GACPRTRPRPLRPDDEDRPRQPEREARRRRARTRQHRPAPPGARVHAVGDRPRTWAARVMAGGCRLRGRARPGVGGRRRSSARRGSGAAVRKALGWLEQPLVGMVARLERWKEQDLFLHAARHVAAMREDVRFVLVGGAILGTEGPYPEKLRLLARNLGLAE